MSVLSGSTIQLLGNDGYLQGMNPPKSNCNDPVATNYNKLELNGKCNYKTIPDGKTGINTNTPFTVLSKSITAGTDAGNYTFMNFLGTNATASANTTIHPKEKTDLGKTYIFKFKKYNCNQQQNPVRNSGGVITGQTVIKDGPPVQLYYGDYVQMQGTLPDGTNTFLNVGGGAGSNKAPGSCNVSDWQTLQIRAPDGGLNGNNPLVLGGEIMLVQTASKTQIMIRANPPAVNKHEGAPPEKIDQHATTESFTDGEKLVSFQELEHFINNENFGQKKLSDINIVLIIIAVLICIYGIVYYFNNKETRMIRSILAKY